MALDQGVAARDGVTRIPGQVGRRPARVVTGPELPGRGPDTRCQRAPGRPPESRDLSSPSPAPPPSAPEATPPTSPGAAPRSRSSVPRRDDRSTGEWSTPVNQSTNRPDCKGTDESDWLD